ncbi:MAG: hypothetical protein Q9208_002455 [Pyrenodesmia sp. 3 TL-2023]
MPPSPDPAIKNAVHEILKKGPFKEMDSEQAERIVRNRNSWCGTNMTNEATGFFGFAKDMFQDFYDIGESNGSGQWVTKKWPEQGLAYTYKTAFTKSAVPSLRCRDDSDEEAVERFPRIRCPRPSMTFGISFSYHEKWIHEIQWLGMHGYNVDISQWMWYPFLVVISPDSTPRTETDAQRAGAVLIEVNRELQACAGMPDTFESEINTSNMVFSFSLDPGIASLRVHWARYRESTKKGQAWIRQICGFDESSVNGIEYMSWRVADYFLCHKEDVKRFRHDLECILSWATTDRMEGPKGINALMDKVTKLMESEKSGGPKHKRETLMEATSSKPEHKRKSSVDLTGRNKIARWMDAAEADAEDQQVFQSTDPIG